MSSNTRQKVAIITGASQGIGAGLAEAYRGRGYRGVLNSRTIKPDRSAAMLAIPGDVGDPQTAGQVVTAAIEHFGRIDTLINNAGIFIAKPFVDYSQADFASVVAVNLGGFFHITQRAAGGMLRQGHGHIVGNHDSAGRATVVGRALGARRAHQRAASMRSRARSPSSMPTRESG